MRRQVGISIRHVRTWPDFPLAGFDVEIGLANWPCRVLGQLIGRPVSAYRMQCYLCLFHSIFHLNAPD